jgi:hypothetical protein
MKVIGPKVLVRSGIVAGSLVCGFGAASIVLGSIASWRLPTPLDEVLPVFSLRLLHSPGLVPLRLPELDLSYYYYCLSLACYPVYGTSI